MTVGGKQHVYGNLSGKEITARGDIKEGETCYQIHEWINWGNMAYYGREGRCLPVSWSGHGRHIPGEGRVNSQRSIILDRSTVKGVKIRLCDENVALSTLSTPDHAEQVSKVQMFADTQECIRICGYPSESLTVSGPRWKRVLSLLSACTWEEGRRGNRNRAIQDGYGTRPHARIGGGAQRSWDKWPMQKGEQNRQPPRGIGQMGQMGRWECTGSTVENDCALNRRGGRQLAAFSVPRFIYEWAICRGMLGTSP